MKKDRDEKYIYRISKQKFNEINNAILKIQYDTIAVKHNMIDGSSSDITLYYDLGYEKRFLLVV